MGVYRLDEWWLVTGGSGLITEKPGGNVSFSSIIESALENLVYF